MKVLIVLHHRFELWNAPQWLAQRLAQDFPQHDFVHLATYEGMKQHLAEAEVFVGWSLRSEQLAVAKKLRWIHSPAAAVHEILKPQVIDSDIVVTNARGVHGSVVAEHVMAQLFALAKRLPSAMRYQRQHVWAQEQLWNESPRPQELSGSTLGLLGFGSIGREVARRALALGMRVIAVREHPSAPGDPASRDCVTVGADRLDDVLQQSDFLVLALPLTSATRGLINAQRLSIMKPKAYIINVGRGPLLDDAALLSALREHRLAGAALDVFAQEPLPQDSPYWDLPNVLITPHSAALTDKLWPRHYELLRENIGRYLSGRPLLFIVDKSRGY